MSGVVRDDIAITPNESCVGADGGDRRGGQSEAGDLQRKQDKWPIRIVDVDRVSQRVDWDYVIDENPVFFSSIGELHMPGFAHWERRRTWHREEASRDPW